LGFNSIWSAFTGFNDKDAVHTNEQNEFFGLEEKPVPDDADHLIIEDSADNNKKEKLE